jgi:hypothetical protein
VSQWPFRKQWNFQPEGGQIITYNQTDSFTIANGKITAIPFYEWAEAGNDV